MRHAEKRQRVLDRDVVAELVAEHGLEPQGLPVARHHGLDRAPEFAFGKVGPTFDSAQQLLDELHALVSQNSQAIN